MKFFGRFSLGVMAAAALLTLNGCLPSDSSPLDEEKEPHFVLGNSRFNSMDYACAIEAFQASLEVNPHSAQAHFRLAQLFDSKQPDPAAAIYHYQEFLRLDPQADNAEVIKQRIYSCKQLLAADVMAMPTAPATQKQLEDLSEKNRSLQDEVDKWRAYYSAQSAVPKNPSGPDVSARASVGSSTPEDVSASANPVLTHSPRTAAARSAGVRTHTVVAGETFAAIARKSGVGLAALEAANPGVTPKKLRVGQTLNLPP
jgi:tetratricopeptide (TPR) repeat protein